MMQASSGRAERTSRHTSTPLPSGRRTSSTATSGLVAGIRPMASSAVPASPFQRPDGTAYLREYTKVLYGSPGAVAEVYARYGIKYFAVDVAKDSSVLWSGFSPMFEPESIRSRMRVAGHEQTDRLDLYLLATRDAGADAGDLDDQDP